MTDVFQVLADPTRRRIVEALKGGERSVGDLVSVAGGIGQPGVSRQLAVLEEAEFVVMRPDGRRRLYSLRPEPFVELSRFLTTYRSIWEGRLDRVARELERGKKRRNRNGE